MSIQAGNQKYEPIVESDQVIGIKQFDSDHNMWIVLRFTDNESNAEEQLMDLLTNEYIRRQSD